MKAIVTACFTIRAEIRRNILNNRDKKPAGFRKACGFYYLGDNKGTALLHASSVMQWRFVFDGNLNFIEKFAGMIGQVIVDVIDL